MTSQTPGHLDQILGHAGDHQPLIDASPVFIQSVDQYGILRDCNIQITPLLGYTRDEVIGKPIAPLIHPEDFPQVRANLPRIMECKETFNQHFRMIHKQGHPVSIYAQSSAIRDPEGRFVQTFCVITDETDLLRTESALSRREEELREAQRVARMGSWRWDYSKDTVIWSEEMYRLFGVPPRLPAPRFAEQTLLFTPESFDRLNQAIQATLQNDTSFEIEIERVCQDGSKRWSLMRGEVIRDSGVQGKPLRGTLQDIHHLKTAEIALRQNEEKYRLLHESLRDAFVRTDMQGNITEFNEAFLILIGYSAEELTRLTFSELTPAPWHAMEHRILKEQVLPLGYSEVYEKEYRTKDGRILPVELRTFLMKDSNNSPAGMWAIVRDISSRVRMLQALKESEQKFRQVVETALEGILVFDAQGRVEYANSRISDMLGYSLGDLIGHSHIDFIPEEDKPEALRRWSRREQGHHEQYEIHVRRKEGTPLFVRISATSRQDTLQNFVGSIIMVSDLTDQRRAEAAIRQSERIAAVGQLAAGVAHELNNPLAVILGFAEGSVKRVSDQDPLKMPLQFIHREASRCQSLVRDLLTFSRDRSPGFRHEDLGQVLRESLSLIESQSHVRRIELHREIPSQIPTAWIDRNQIQQVLINLCTNAMDAMPDGGVLTVTLRIQESTFEILVQDTGTGIAPEIQHRIFEPFFTTKDVGRGTGLGLGLVYDIVNKHKGTIRFETEAHRGTTFCVTLPFDSSVDSSRPHA